MSENQDRRGSSDRPRRQNSARPDRASGERRRGGSGGGADSGRSGGAGRFSSGGGQRQDRRGVRHNGGPRRDDRPSVHNPSDLRSANRPDRAKSPEIDDDITGKELDRATSRELDSLDERNRPWVARHLVMAGRLLDIDPQLAFEHALAASRRGGRLGCVREAVGLTAYGAGEYAEALREFRTYRRITGDNTHVPEMVDSERALGRHEKALELAGEVDHASLDKAIRAELVMVLSGIHRDLGDPEAALAVLRVPELDRNRGFSFSPRLFRAYADALEESGRHEEASAWQRQAVVAERALGTGDFEEPEIVDFGVDDEADSPRPERRPRARDLVPPASAIDEVAGESSALAKEDLKSMDTLEAPVGEHGEHGEHGEPGPQDH
ncbi:tetratricopeptide repeat protein [Citricoccus nitrophenolicus]|uniref:tetratricopeptide repeat protein n=1 Tax=Citricoccus nitrophenolicus TaxID=863575 RepID=UPI0031E5672A